MIDCFVFIESHGIFEGPALETVLFVYAIVVKNLLNRSILGLLGLNNFILYFLDPSRFQIQEAAISCF